MPRMSAAAQRVLAPLRGVKSSPETPYKKIRRPVPRPCRRSDFDVTDTVQVSRPAAVREAVLELYADTWPGAPREGLEKAFRDFESLFAGQTPGFLGVDTVYHDLQHSQDVVLAMARLLAGYERVPDGPRLGAERGLVALITALFHDSGYIRESGESSIANGAVFTRNHVTRSARFIAKYLPDAGLGNWVPISTRIVHFTGYEVPLDLLRVADARDRLAGHMLGTADMLAQMADRCYLEKCRDRLYAEFVLGNVAVHAGAEGVKVLYGSGLDLLRRAALRRRQPVHERDPPECAVPQGAHARQPLADAAPQSAGVHGRIERHGRHAHAPGPAPEGSLWRVRAPAHRELTRAKRERMRGGTSTSST
jgi:hypothetical protein